MTPIWLSAVSPTIDRDRDEQSGAQHRQQRPQTRRVRRRARLAEPRQTALERRVGDLPDDDRREHRRPDRDQSRQDARPDLAALEPAERVDAPEFEQRQAGQERDRDVHDRPRDRYPAASAEPRPAEQTERRRSAVGVRRGRAVEYADYNEGERVGRPATIATVPSSIQMPAGAGLETGRPADPARRDREQREVVPH